MNTAIIKKLVIAVFLWLYIYFAFYDKLKNKTKALAILDKSSDIQVLFYIIRKIDLHQHILHLLLLIQNANVCQ